MFAAFMKTLFFLVSITCTHLAIAQTDSAARFLEEIVVTAHRAKEKSLLVPYSLATINKEHLRHFGSRTTPEALQGVGGVFVQKTNHGGGSPFVRGLTGNQTLLLVDGIRLNNATFRYGPNQYLNTVDAYTIDRIEIAKGTGSVQYGTDALGGVINILTKEPQFAEKQSLHGKILGKYMTRDMEKTVRGELDYTSQKAAFSGGLTYRKFGDLYGGDTIGRQHPSGYKEWSFNAKLKLQLSATATLSFANQFLQQSGVPVYHKIVLENFRINEMAIQQRNLHYLRYQKSLTSRLAKTIELTASWQQQLEERNMQKNSSTTLTNEKDKTNTMGLNFAVQSQLKAWWSARSGVDVYADKVNSKRSDETANSNAKSFKRGLYPDGGKHNSYSLYSLHHISLNKWTIDAGVRYNKYAIQINDTSLGKVNIKPSALIGNAGVSYHLNKQHHLYVSFNQGFRVPNLDDVGTLGVVDFRYEVPEYNLQPEKSANFEAGYKLSTKVFSAQFAAYYMKLYDFITRIRVEGQMINNYPVYQKLNSDKAYIKGAEADMSLDILKQVNIRGNISYNYGQNVSKAEPLRRIPPLHGRIAGRFRKDRWYTAVEMMYASKQDRLAKGDKDDNRIPAGGTPGFTVLNFFAGYQINVLNFNFGLQNILNIDYRTHGSGINGVGRSAWLSASINL